MKKKMKKMKKPKKKIEENIRKERTLERERKIK